MTSQSKYFSLPLRIGYLGIGTLVFVAAYYAGATMRLADQDAEEIRSSFIEDVQNIDEVGIFLNNVEIALAMFIPGAGAGIGVFSGVSTGMVFNAFSMISPELAGTHPLSVLATPFGMLEVLAYGLAISRSGMIVAKLAMKGDRTKGWKRFGIYTGIEIGLVITALVAGSVIETQTIEAQV